MTENEDLISRSTLLDSFRKCYSGHMGMENSDNMMMFKSICRIINDQEAIGTIDEFKALKEKVEPKKPLPKGTHKGIDNFYCPNCNHPLTNRHEQCELPYCDICGQKLDWSE